MHRNTFAWAGTLALMAISIMLIAISWPVVDDWREEWKEYVHETRFGGVCSGPNPPSDPCDDNPPVERWQVLPYTLTVGLAGGLLAICLIPVSGGGGGRGGGLVRKAGEFIRSQR